MKSNGKHNTLGLSQTSTNIKEEVLSSGETVNPLNKHSYKTPSPRVKRRRIQKKTLYSPEPFAEGRSEFLLRTSARTCCA